MHNALWFVAAPPCRVCIVNSAGNVVLDTYCRPLEKVTDYRTKVSGGLTSARAPKTARSCRGVSPVHGPVG